MPPNNRSPKRKRRAHPPPKQKIRTQATPPNQSPLRAATKAKAANQNRAVQKEMTPKIATPNPTPIKKRTRIRNKKTNNRIHHDPASSKISNLVETHRRPPTHRSSRTHPQASRPAAGSLSIRYPLWQIFSG